MFLERCFKCRKIEDMLVQMKHTGLKRSLGLFQLVILGIGAIVGVGILVLTGAVASHNTGSAIVISFALSAVTALCTGLCYAELSAAIPISGGIYNYMYVAVGELAAWIFGMLSFLFLWLTISVVSVGWSGYLQSYLVDYSLVIPHMFAHANSLNIDRVDVINSFGIDLPAFCIVAFITIVSCLGTKSISLINTISVFIKVSILSSFIIFGITKINPLNFDPFIPENTGTFGIFGLSGIIGGASMVFMAYCGFDLLASATQESKNPQRNIPLSIIISLTLVAVIYILVSGTMVGLVNYKLLDNPAPIALAVDALKMPIFSKLVKIGAIVGLIPVMIGLLFGVSRTLFSIAKDGLLPRFLSKVDANTHVPISSILVSGSIASVLGAIMPLKDLIGLINICAIVTYSSVCIVCLYLRYSQPGLHRDFKCPLMPFIPLCALLSYAFMLYSFPAATYKGLFLIIMTLLMIYIFYGIKHSTLHTKNISSK